jgi:hypothetical protein
MSVLVAGLRRCVTGHSVAAPSEARNHPSASWTLTVGDAVELRELGAVELAYAALEHVDYGSGGQWYGTMDGSLEGPRLAGTLALTNIATNRPDNVNTPTLRGLLRTHDGAELWVELDGLARLQGETRVFVTSVKLRTGDERYAWVNTFFGVLEGTLQNDGTAQGRIYECLPGPA